MYWTNITRLWCNAQHFMKSFINTVTKTCRLGLTVILVLISRAPSVVSVTSSLHLRHCVFCHWINYIFSTIFIIEKFTCSCAKVFRFVVFSFQENSVQSKTGFQCCHLCRKVFIRKGLNFDLKMSRRSYFRCRGKLISNCWLGLYAAWREKQWKWSAPREAFV